MLFTREHVLPQSFGKFENNLVLNNKVCAACNAYFSAELDELLARDSMEGLARYQHGLKDPAEVDQFRFETVRLSAPELGDYTGVPLKLAGLGEGGGLVAVPGAAAGFRNKVNDSWVWFTLAQIQSGEWRDSDVDWRLGVKISGSAEDVATIQQALEEQGVQFQNWRPLEGEPKSDPYTIEHVFELTRNHRRAFAKIAFNYAAWYFGAEFVLAPAFDAARRFIRNDEGDARWFGISEDDLPFKMVGHEDERPLAHWIDLGGHTSHRNLIGNVMLMGFMTHTTVLVADFAGPWPELPVAHFFNLKHRRVDEMEPAKPRWRHPDRAP